MDEKDIRILKAAAAAGTDSAVAIHEHTGIPKSTVHYRLKQLREEGVVKNDLLEMDLSKIGLEIAIISEVYAEFGEGYHDDVGEKLANIEGVNQVYFTMGDTDFVLVAHATSREMVETLVEEYESIDEVTRTSSKFVITTVKNETYPINDFEVDTLVAALAEE